MSSSVISGDLSPAAIDQAASESGNQWVHAGPSGRDLDVWLCVCIYQYNVTLAYDLLARRHKHTERCKNQHLSTEEAGRGEHQSSGFTNLMLKLTLAEGT